MQNRPKPVAGNSAVALLAQRRFLPIGILPVLLSLFMLACESAYSIRRNISFNNAISEQCFLQAAMSIGEGATLKHVENPNGPREFDEYLFSDNFAVIDVLWFRHGRHRMEIGYGGLGRPDQVRDQAICNLIREFYAALLDYCSIEAGAVSYEDKYNSSRCAAD